MIKHYLRIMFPFALVAVGISPGAVTFRVLTGQYYAPTGLVEGGPGIFYSISSSNIVFSSTSSGKTTDIANSTGFQMEPSLVGAANGRFYAAAWISGSPTTNVFSVSSMPGSLLEYSAQSITPFLAQNLPDGTLVGGGGSFTSGQSYVLKVDLNGNVTPIAPLPPGHQVEFSPIYATDGNYYGVGWDQPANTSYVYKATPSGAFSMLYTFPNGSVGSITDGVPIIQASDGNLYGVTTYTGGSTGGNGTVYKLTLGGQYTLLHNFTGGASAHPQALIQASDGNLYGATLGNGGPSIIFRISTSGQYSVVQELSLSTIGQCPCTLLQGSDGNIYGTSALYGAQGNGTVFAMEAGLPKPAPKALAFSPRKGPVGTRVRSWGYNQLQAAVQFNGVAAAIVKNSGPNYVWATVPAGATSGPITVTTPGGISTTAASFTVD